MADKILVLRLSALGDVAMTVPAVYSVARKYPDLRLTVVTRPFFRRLFLDPPQNVDFIEYNGESIRGLWKFIGWLRREDFTAVADLHDVLRTRLIRASMRMAHIPVVSVDKDRHARKRLTDKKERDFQKGYIERYFDVFSALGYPAEDTFEGFFRSDAPRLGIGIAPFARYMTKTYPPKLMEKVARMLTDKGITVTLFGARGREEQILKGWVERNPALRLAAGKFSIEDELREMSRLRAMITMDSANMHMASLVGTPVVSVWGSTIPQCGFMGWRQKTENAVWLDLECQPCSVAGLESCPIGHYACLERIDPQTIVDKVLEIIR